MEKSPPTLDEDLPDPFDEHDTSPQELLADEAPAGPLAVVAWLDARIGLEELSNVARKKTVPLHRHDFWYYFGGITLFFFVMQLLTGLLLLVYYQPGVNTAHPSVQRVTSQVEFGWLIRSVHSWSANLMLLAAFVHMLSVYFMKAFRPPRELTWGTGIVL
ncbi:MAG TPA: cytochrome b N-terminal domain-containing protein, partial [Polyangiaceae bacterium]